MTCEKCGSDNVVREAKHDVDHCRKCGWRKYDEIEETLPMDKLRLIDNTRPCGRNGGRKRAYDHKAGWVPKGTHRKGRKREADLSR